VHVIATAGHVDHGKSTLVRALTGMEPDRWEQERRRGLTIDLGYAWTTDDPDEAVAFVDVPGHERFIGNMLAGLGPAPAVLFVVSADAGWQAQSEEHLAAVDALGLTHGLLVVTRSDLADPAAALAQSRARIGASSLGEVAVVAVSGRTGAGLDALRAALARLTAAMPKADVDARVRLWVDRAFSVRGSGTVVTGTLGAGRVRVGDELVLGGRRVGVRGLESLGRARDRVEGVARVAVNLRGVAREQVRRGDALLAPGAWRETSELDVRLAAPLPAAGFGTQSWEGGPPARGLEALGAVSSGVGPPTREPVDAATLHGDLVLHVGSAAQPVHVRPLDGDTARLSLRHALPLQAGDRAILRDPGRHTVVAGVVVLDADPPALRRRGAARRRGSDLETATGEVDPATEAARRGAVRTAELEALGATPDRLAAAPSGVLRHGDWWVDERAWQRWQQRLGEAVDAAAREHPLNPELPLEAARATAAVPDLGLLRAAAESAGLEIRGGALTRPGTEISFGAAEAGLRWVEDRLGAEPFAAPEQPDLEARALGERELAAAERAGRMLRLADGVVLLPSGPALAMRVLAALPQPFTTSQARQALGTTRRVVIPLLEHLDARGWTRRIDAGHRTVVR
jgi:selenocysteine-specific elongation factor